MPLKSAPVPRTVTPVSGSYDNGLAQNGTAIAAETYTVPLNVHTSGVETMQIEISGQRILEVRNLTKTEKEREGWDDYGSHVAIVLENGIILYASRDSEGNGPGELFGTTSDGRSFQV